MARTQQTFRNDKDSPIYVSVEPWPKAFELEPGEKLTLIWSSDESGDTANVNFVNDCELVVWPNGETDEMQFLIDGKDALARNWKFKHK